VSRIIKYRGVVIGDLTWVYGYLVEHGDRSFIFSGELDTTGLYPTWSKSEVIPETVGQFVEKHDCDGTEIYDGDSIDASYDKSMLVSWNEKYASFCLDKTGWIHSHWFGEAVEAENCKVIGNIHENPELLGD